MGLSDRAVSTVDRKTFIRPLQVQCRSHKVEKSPSLISRLHTWLVCRKDPFDIDWTASLVNVLATGLFVADIISDFAVAVYHFQEKNYGYASISFAFVLFPLLVSIGYYPVYKKYPWYFAHPFEPIYWCKKTFDEYRILKEQRKSSMGREEAWDHYNSVKNFRTSNWARVSAVRLEVHLEALPQLIFQSYTIAELLHDRDLKNISWFSWAAVALSTVSLAMYHHTLALAQAKILDTDPEMYRTQDLIARPSPSILFDVIGQGFLDALYIVIRAVSLACLFTVGPYMWLVALGFFTIHLTTAYGLMWFAGPKDPNEFQPDFRLIFYNRTNHPDILTAAVASLIFPPLMDVKLKMATGKSCIDHLLTAGTRTFWIAGMLQVLETDAMLIFWFRLNGDMIAENTRIITMAAVTSLMLSVLLGHVLYVTCIYMPIKQRERLKCCRKKGIMARCWLLEIADVHYNYLHEVVMPRLTNSGFTSFTRKNSSVDNLHAHNLHHQQQQQNGRLSPNSQCTLTTEDLTWLTDTLLIVAEGDGPKTDAPKWQRKYFFHTIIPVERVLLSKIGQLAQRQLDEVVRFGAVYDTDEKRSLIQDCKNLIGFWLDVVLACITHQRLPKGLEDIVTREDIHKVLQWYADSIKREEEDVQIEVRTEVQEKSDALLSDQHAEFELSSLSESD